MTGFELVTGVAVLFFAAGILTGVLGVLALSAMRDNRGRGTRRRYATRRAESLDWEDRPGWEGQRRPDEIGEAPPPWPGGRRDLAPAAAEGQ